MSKVYVAGEGVHELGRWGEEPQYRANSARSDGVLMALFWKQGRTGEVVDGKRWRDVRKYRAGGHATAEQRTLRGLLLHAEEAGADLLLWARDTDHETERSAELSEEQNRLRADAENEVQLAGGTAVPSLEAWIVALARLDTSPEKRSQSHLDSLTQEHDLDTEEKMVELINSRPLDTTRSPSLQAWLEQL